MATMDQLTPASASAQTARSAHSARSARSAREVLAWSRALVDPAMRAAVDTMPGPAHQIIGYHLGWWDEHGRPAQGDGGKALRPTLVLLAAEAVAGSAEAAVPGAVAVELVHNFSLLHDDVMDGDLTRRHRPTAWVVFGAASAILAGDVLAALAFEVLAAGGHPTDVLSAAVLDLLRGQSADMAFEGRSDVGLSECVSMAAGKTGALLGCACALGAELGGGNREQVEQLRGFGEKVGLAFQLTDDLLGIWGDPAVTGKPVFSDLQNRKKSLPVVAALTSGTTAGHELAALYLGADPLDEPGLIRAAELIELAGGRTWAQTRAEELLAESLHHLHAVNPPPRPAAELTTLAQLIAHRDH